MRAAGVLAALACLASFAVPTQADTTSFFRSCQVATPVGSGVTSETIRSHGYVFTYTRDKLFTGGTGQPIGRPVRVAWPAGIEAQAVTTPPPGVTDYKARITIQRADGQLFDLTAFTAQLLANTGGAGGAIEIMPMLQGEDGFPDPLYFDVSGYYGQTFSYDTSPNPLGSTALLTGFDTYKVSLYVDFALVALTLNSLAPGERACCLPAPSCSDLTTEACLVQGGAPMGIGTSCGCDACLPTPAPPSVPDGRNATTPLLAARLTEAGDSLRVRWDASSCPAVDYNLIYGDLAHVSGYVLNGALCGMGTTGTYDWTGVAAGDLFFLIVGTDGVETEGSWGPDGAGQERNGSVPSAACGVSVKNPTRTCP